jgi:hypothetical protein
MFSAKFCYFLAVASVTKTEAAGSREVEPAAWCAPERGGGGESSGAIDVLVLALAR